MEISAIAKLCVICKTVGTRKAIEKLPNNGILWRVEHEDGTICEWGEYDSFNDLTKHREPNPPQMICPRCEQNGIVSAWRQDPTNKPDTYRYTIKHYYNPKHKFLSKQCQIITQTQRDSVLKALGRYIEHGIDKKTYCVSCRSESTYTGRNEQAMLVQVLGGAYQCNKCYGKQRYHSKKQEKRLDRLDNSKFIT